MRHRLAGTGVGLPTLRRWAQRQVRRLRLARQSLRFRLTLGLTLALGIILSAFVVLQYQVHQERTLREAEANLTSVGQIIEGSLEHAMLTRDLAELQEIIDNLAARPHLRSIVLLNTQGEVRFASGGQGVGSRPNLGDPGCRVCHSSGQPPRTGSVTFTTAGGERVLRNCNPIANQPACYGCHDPGSRLTGALLTDFSLAETNAYLAGELRATVAAGVVVIVVAALVVNLFLHRLLLSRLDQMMVAIRRFGAGDRAQRVPAGEADEISRLATAFNQMAAGLEAREEEAARLYQELAQKEAARAQLLRQTIRAQEEERKRIARELHDDLAQTLTALTVGLETALHTLPAAMRALGDQLARVRDLTTAMLGQTHQWIEDLRPMVLDDLGLVPAIRWYAGARLEASGIQVSLEIVGPKERLAPELETTLFRVVQEAINNAAKHSRARHVAIRLEFAATGVKAEVEDDGVGFDPQEPLPPHEDMRGIGLLGMRERVGLVGGRLAVESRPGQGTRIQIEVPWAA